VVGRTRAFLADLLREHDGARVLVIAHSANRWAIEHLVRGTPLADLIEERFEWQPGWEYVLDARAATIL
jgi:broad specificity phosphatase PhoE